MIRLLLPLLVLGVSTLAAPADKNTNYYPQQVGISASSVSSGNGNYGTHISVVAPEGALVNRFQGSSGEQGVIVSHGTSGPAGGGFGGAVSSSSSSSSTFNGNTGTGTQQSSSTSVNNNGEVTSVLVSNNKPF